MSDPHSPGREQEQVAAQAGATTPLTSLAVTPRVFLPKVSAERLGAGAVTLLESPEARGLQVCTDLMLLLGWKSSEPWSGMALAVSSARGCPQHGLCTQLRGCHIITEQEGEPFPDPRLSLLSSKSKGISPRAQGKLLSQANPQRTQRLREILRWMS